MYWVHRLVHASNKLGYFHRQHHKVINSKETKWHWNNIFLYNDDVKSTIDYWITEVIPTLIFCYVTSQWWIFLLYYVYAAFIQENIEHSNEFYFPFLCPGKWHMIHHNDFRYNYGLFFTFWDKLFKTEKNIGSLV
jgi:lathosterol oxidase